MEHGADLELCGGDQRKRAQLRVHRLWPWLSANRHVANTGRAFGLDDVGSADADAVAAFARDQGAVPIHFLAEPEASEMRRCLAAHGLEAPVWTIFLDTTETWDVCANVKRGATWPAGCTLHDLTADAPGAFVRAFQAANQACGVAALPGYVLRGGARPSAASAVVALDGTVVATGCAMARHNPKGSLADTIWKGLLGTREDWRGRGLATAVFAHIALRAYNELGARQIYAAVQADNPASRAVCEAIGLRVSRYRTIAAIDPQQHATGFTR